MSGAKVMEVGDTEGRMVRGIGLNSRLDGQSMTFAGGI